MKSKEFSFEHEIRTTNAEQEAATPWDGFALGKLIPPDFLDSRPDKKYPYPRKVVLGVAKVSIAGIDLPVELTYHTNKDNDERDNFELVLGRPDAKVEGAVRLRYLADDRIEAGTDIHRYDPAEKLPKGLGALIYPKLLELIPELASKKGISIVHIVQKLPINSFGRFRLSSERWNEIFVPILAARGYARTQEEDKENSPH